MKAKPHPSGCMSQVVSLSNQITRRDARRTSCPSDFAKATPDRLSSVICPPFSDICPATLMAGKLLFSDSKNLS